MVLAGLHEFWHLSVRQPAGQPHNPPFPFSVHTNPTVHETYPGGKTDAKTATPVTSQNPQNCGQFAPSAVAATPPCGVGPRQVVSSSRHAARSVSATRRQ